MLRDGKGARVMSWATKEVREELKVMLADGRTAREMADRYGVSRNAVIGIVSRDKALKEVGFALKPGWNGSMAGKTTRKSNPTPSLPRASRKGVRGGKISLNRLKVAPTPPIVEMFDGVPDTPGRFGAPHVAGIDLMMLTECRCKWPLNDGGPFLFCGEAKKSDGAYCAFHAQASIGKGTESERTAVRSALKVAA